MDVPIPTSINIILLFSIDTLWDLSNNTEQSMFSWHVENRFEFLVTLRESEKYQVYTHSRRLIRHVKFNGDVIREYEYHKDGQTRLFTLPYRVIQNRNTDICVVNKTSGSSDEPMILSSSGCVNVVSRGQAVVKKCLFFDVVCDSHFKRHEEWSESFSESERRVREVSSHTGRNNSSILHIDFWLYTVGGTQQKTCQIIFSLKYDITKTFLIFTIL